MSMPTVPLPDSGLIIRKSGKYKYVYKVLRTYRNTKGQPTNDRKLIGSLSEDGRLIPNKNYYSNYQCEEQSDTPNFGKVKSGISIGASFLIDQILNRLGVVRILSDVFDAAAVGMILTIATYMVCRGNVTEYISDWCEECSLTELVTPQKASYLFSTIPHNERINFFKKWVAINPTDIHLAYDVTSFSTYAKGMRDAEWGYNRDGDKLPQINMGFYLSQMTGIPLFYVTYPGSIVDKSHMPYMMAYNDELCIHDVTFVMDRGFCTTSNLQWLHSNNMRYVMAVDTFHKTTKAAIDEVRADITSLRYRIDDGTNAKTIHSRFYGVKSEMHVYYIAENAQQQRNDLFRLAISKGEILKQISQITPKELKYYSRFYDIELKADKTFSFSINYNKIDHEARNCGYFCILSNTMRKNDDILEIYRKKDIIEKGFDDLKNHIDMKRIHTHNDDTTGGKLFCAFIALIATSQMAEPLKEINKSSGKRRLSKTGLLTELEKIKVIAYSRENRLMNPLTKRQRLILTAFGLTEKELMSYASCTHP
jgi:transposase